MAFHSSEKKEEILAAVFDIGSGSVGGALVRIDKEKAKRKFNPFSLAFEPASEKKPEILYAARTPIRVRGEFNSASFLLGAEKALAETAGKLQNARLGAPKKVFAFLAAPFYAGQTRIVKYKKSSPFSVTEKLYSDLIQKEIKNFKSLEALSAQGSRLLEESVTLIKLNGYQVKDPFGKRAKELEIALFISVAPEEALSRIEYRIRKIFNLDIIFHSFLFSSFVAARDIYGEKNFLFLDIAGEITDLALVKDDRLEESISFPWGRNHLIRAISRKFTSDIYESEALLSLYVKGCLDKDICGRLEEAMGEESREYLRHLRDSLEEIAPRGGIPSKIYFTSDDDIAGWLKGVMARDEFVNYRASKNKINVIMIGSAELSSLVLCKDEAERDPFLMLEAFFIKRVI